MNNTEFNTAFDSYVENWAPQLNIVQDCFVPYTGHMTGCEQFSNDWRAQMYRHNCTNMCTEFENIPFQLVWSALIKGQVVSDCTRKECKLL